MSDATSGSPQQPQQQRTPDLMDNDPFLVNLKALHEETKSDDEEPVEPSTSRQKKFQHGNVIHPTKYYDPGRFAWIWLMGIRVPAMVIDGEPNIPIEILDEVLSKQDPADAIAFQNLLHNKHVSIRMGSQYQFNEVCAKSDMFRELKVTSLSMMSRSDIERIMAELRLESPRTNAEHDIWDSSDRVHIFHANFIDDYPGWLDDEGDLDEDIYENGTHGYWYKSRVNMRCIECRECRAKFNPADFVLHHHNPIVYSGPTHIGSWSVSWKAVIDIHRDDLTEENVAAWRKFVIRSHQSIGKRAYYEAAPQESKKIREVEPIIDVVGEEEEVEEVADTETETEKYEYKRKIESDRKKRAIARYIGPYGAKELHSSDKLEKIIIKYLKRLDKDALEALFLKSPEEYKSWEKESRFGLKVAAQQKLWREKTNDPNYKTSGSANFCTRKGMFENIHQLNDASKSTKLEIQQLTESFVRLNKEAKEVNMDQWDFMKKEHELLKDVSSDALRILNNQPPLPPPPPPLPLLKPKMDFSKLPISFANINFNQLTQQLVASGIKIPIMPTPLPTSFPTPPATVTTPVTPMGKLSTISPLPTLPITPNFEFLKHNLTTALNNPNLFPIFYPKLPTNPFEQLGQISKAPTVLN